VRRPLTAVGGCGMFSNQDFGLVFYEGSNY
jgi:hypothetical protein